MNISYERITLTINDSEARTIFFSLVKGIEHTIDTHWKRYPDSYPARECERLSLIRDLAPYANHDAHNVTETLQGRLDALLVKKEGA